MTHIQTHKVETILVLLRLKLIIEWIKKKKLEQSLAEAGNLHLVQLWTPLHWGGGGQRLHEWVFSPTAIQMTGDPQASTWFWLVFARTNVQADVMQHMEIRVEDCHRRVYPKENDNCKYRQLNCGSCVPNLVSNCCSQQAWRGYWVRVIFKLFMKDLMIGVWGGGLAPGQPQSSMRYLHQARENYTCYTKSVSTC